MNFIKTLVLLTALTLLFVFIGGLLGGSQGMRVAFMIACVMNFLSYWFSDKIVLALYGAKPVIEAEAPELTAIVSHLAQRAEIPLPKIYVIPSEACNAFATGRSPRHAAVAVTQGILRILTREELEGVLGHELSHILHRDILIATLAATIAGAISMLADWARWAMIFGGGSRQREERGGGNPIAFLIALVIAPIAALLIQLAISRSREFHADEGGARLTENPLYLASALKKLEAAAPRFPLGANPSTAHLFIVNPLRGGAALLKLFSTHPPMEERVRRLEAIAR